MKEGHAGKVLSEQRCAVGSTRLSGKTARVKGRRQQEMVGVGWGQGLRTHPTGEPESGREEFAPSSMGTKEPLQAFEHRAAKISLARDLRI